MRIHSITAGIVIMMTASGPAATAAEEWFTFDAARKSVSSDLLTLTHGRPSSGYWGNGIIALRFRPTNENFALTLDAYGCGSGAYDRTGPSTYRLNRSNADMVEIEVRYTDCVKVTKFERLYRGLPVVEIEYTSLSLLWFEDFFANPAVPVSFAIDGVDRDITRSLWQEKRCKTIEGDENFGDCFLRNLGVTPQQCAYKGFLIFGAHSQSTGKGVGELYPVSMGTYDWKVWWFDSPVPNYESFPSKSVPVKRYIFLYSGGRQGMAALGRKIADWVAGGPKPVISGTLQCDGARPVARRAPQACPTTARPITLQGRAARAAAGTLPRGPAAGGRARR